MIPQGGQCRDPWLAPSPPRAGHGNGAWPESSKYIEEQFGHLPADVAYKITCENAGKFYVAAACLVDHAAKIIENCVVQADRDLGLARLRSDGRPTLGVREIDVAISLSSGLFHQAPSPGSR